MALNEKKALIVGGGASGVLTAIHLLRSEAKLDIDLAEPNDQLGLGIAYSTTDFAHLLNVPAAKMSALFDEPDHFMKWADARPDQFVPRALFGEYLEETLEESIMRAREEKIFTHLAATATSVTRSGSGWSVTFSDGAVGEYQVVVIATGNGDVNVHSIFRVLDGNPRVVADVWGTSVPKDYNKIAILGTGLTFVDQAISILNANPTAEVFGISRDGLIPFPHTKPEISISADDLEFPTARSIVDFINSYKENWREAQDSLRSRFQMIWHKLPETEKNIFVDIYLSWWKNHRHRIAEPVYNDIARYLNDKRLHVMKGRVEDFELVDESIRLTLTRGEILYVDAILNCTGNQYEVTNPLLKDLIAQGTLAPGPLDFGIACDIKTLALKGGDGSVQSGLFGLGPVLVGELFETTAIPEIRTQAWIIASQLAK
ncbi:MAG: FAD/NAD(P)-binding protein [Actinomycetes bacterium]